MVGTDPPQAVAALRADEPAALVAQRTQSDERQPLPVRGDAEPFIPAHEGQPPGLAVCGDEGRGELEGVCGAQRVRPQQAPGEPLQVRPGLHLRPRLGQQVEARERRLDLETLEEPNRCRLRTPTSPAPSLQSLFSCNFGLIFHWPVQANSPRLRPD